MTESEFDALTARVIATPDGKRWMDELMQRGSIPMTFAVADWKERIRRERERWRTGSLTPP